MTGRILEGKVVVVTGSGQGIGREFALAAAAEGAKVVVNDIGTSLGGEGSDTGLAHTAAREIRELGGEAVANSDSVATWSSAHKIVECALDNFGRIDGVVNNAGILRDRMFHRMSEEEITSVLQVHLFGAFFVSRAAAPHFKEQGSGSFVHLTSTSGLIGQVGQANYAAAKMGLVGLSQSIALEMKSAGVRSNCIAPSAWSRMVASIPSDTPEKRAKIERIKNRLAASKIPPMACYLLSDVAKEVTGQVFYVRGDEIFLFNNLRPIRSVHRSGGWTPQSIAEHAIPALKGNFVQSQVPTQVFTWDPI